MTFFQAIPSFSLCTRTAKPLSPTFEVFVVIGPPSSAGLKVSAVPLASPGLLPAPASRSRRQVSRRRACWHHTGDAHHLPFLARPSTRAVSPHLLTTAPSCPREPETGRGAKALRAPSFCLNRASSSQHPTHNGVGEQRPFLSALVTDTVSPCVTSVSALLCTALRLSTNESFSPLLRMPLPQALEPLPLLQNLPDRSFHLPWNFQRPDAVELQVVTAATSSPNFLPRRLSKPVKQARHRKIARALTQQQRRQLQQRRPWIGLSFHHNTLVFVSSATLSWTSPSNLVWSSMKQNAPLRDTCSALHVTKPETEGLRCASARNLLLTTSIARQGLFSSTSNSEARWTTWRWVSGLEAKPTTHRSKPRS